MYLMIEQINYFSLLSIITAGKYTLIMYYIIYFFLRIK
jgi:hypothetical protein